MSNTQTDPSSEEQTRPRITLGKLATEIAQEFAGRNKITQSHLDDAIRQIQSQNQKNSGTPDWLRTQLQTMNELLSTLRYMVQATVAETDTQIQSSLAQLNKRMDALQLEAAKSANLDHPALQKLYERMEEAQFRQHEPVIEAEKGKAPDREI